MTEDTINTLLGLVALYAMLHFYVIQFTKTYTERNWYEKTITIVAAVFVFLILIGLGAK